MATEREVRIPQELVDRLVIDLAPAQIHALDKLPQVAIDTIAELEKLTQAYLLLNSSSWMGTVIHSNYWEDMPQSPLAVRKAIEKIGSQAMYWTAYANEARAGRLGIAPDTFRNVLEINSGKILHVVDDDKRSKEFASERFRDPNDYSSYIVQTNWIGDGDFWGVWQPSIFPMKVKILGSVYAGNTEYERVTASTLGISTHLVEKSWNSWRNFFTAYGVFYAEVIGELSGEGAFANPIKSPIADLLKQGKSFERPFQLAKALYEIGLMDDDSDKAITNAIALAGRRMSDKIVNGGETFDFLGSSDALAANLNEMWQLAKDSQK